MSSFTPFLEEPGREFPDLMDPEEPRQEIEEYHEDHPQDKASDQCA
jgi:hypothetical protein